MTGQQIIRAWRDAEYCNQLSEAERRAPPTHPAGAIELPDYDLPGVAGGLIFQSVITECHEFCGGKAAPSCPSFACG
jgi:mersacidin/lichenicidin family type 2 lantibiotic